jgi:hypothetical protein
MLVLPDRNPYSQIPADFLERSRRWTASAESLVSAETPFAFMAVENLMFAERHILEMERALARRADESSDPAEPLVLKECSAHSILWLFGLYELTRDLRQAGSVKFPKLETLHRKLEIIRMPLAKHEVAGGKRNPTPHFPTSTWQRETGRVGWHVFNPDTTSLELLVRTELADEFLDRVAS